MVDPPLFALRGTLLFVRLIFSITSVKKRFHPLSFANFFLAVPPLNREVHTDYIYCIETKMPSIAENFLKLLPLLNKISLKMAASLPSEN